MATEQEVKQYLLDSILNATPSNALKYAEAWAWLEYPNQPHGVSPS